MSARQPLAAGVIVVLVATVVLVGWTFDITAAKSVMTGWRVMVPGTAASFVLIGLAMLFGTSHRVESPVIEVPRALALGAMVVPLITFIEYLSGARTGVENWFGNHFNSASEVAGRMSPIASVCLLSIGGALLAATSARQRWIALSRVLSGSTLLTSWLAVLAIAFDYDRLADAPRFPGMALITIAMMAVASWGALSLTFERTGFFRAAGVRPSREGAALALVFLVPLMLGWLRDAADPAMPQQLVTALLVFALTASLAAIVWHYATRMASLRHEREVAYGQLEERVTERTGELASRNTQLTLSEDRLRDADRRKDEFLATLAHELRNPLAPIRTAVAILKSDHVTDCERNEARRIIDRQVTHMARLIDDLLDVSRIAAGKLPLRRSRLQLHQLVDLAITTLRPLIDQARHRLTVSLPADIVTLDGDEARLSQVLANLLHNACKYTEPGGDIAVVASLAGAGEVAISVRDNGIGIPPDFLPRVFDKFSQVAPALARSQGGMGLGLSLVRGIIAAHGGRVAARSDGEGKGSEFVVYLPIVATVPAPVVSQQTSGGSADRVSRRVIVVDDNTDSAEAMAVLLRSIGHQVETASDGEVALEIAERFQPDAMLLDLGLPKLNGFEVCKRVRSKPWGSSILLVAQTGWGQPQDRASTHAAGFDAHLTKPVDPDAVQEMLTNLKPV